MADEHVISEIKRGYIENLLAKGKRMDGRNVDEIRKVSIIMENKLGMAEGSARVKLGDTDVICGIKVVLGDPYPDSKDKGVMTTTAELVPLASPFFETGPPSPESVEVARVVDRGIRESETINLRSLKVPEENKVFVVFIDIYPLDMDGNLIDAATVAVMKALSNTIVPAAELTKNLDHPMEDFKLPLAHMPIAVTGVKIGDTVILDPTQDEEDIAGARLTVTTDENGDIRAMQKGNIGRLSPEDIDLIVNLSIEKGKEIRKVLMSEGNPPAPAETNAAERIDS
jgi:exosome complex component RRP42